MAGSAGRVTAGSTAGVTAGSAGRVTVGSSNLASEGIAGKVTAGTGKAIGDRTVGENDWLGGTIGGCGPRTWGDVVPGSVIGAKTAGWEAATSSGCGEEAAPRNLPTPIVAVAAVLPAAAATTSRVGTAPTNGSSPSNDIGPTTRCSFPTEMFKNARTTAGSNWTPAHRANSLRAASVETGRW
jgi:hypothetical protein